MIKDSINKITSRVDLSIDESRLLLNEIMKGNLNNSQIAGLLLSLKTKGETSNEVAGFALAILDNAIKISDFSDSVDVCGTGGDDSGTFNISTAAAFVVAGAGYKVAKHGNRSISSKSGSADVLIELGIDVNLSPEQSKQALEKVGISFLFAPNYHPAMKYVMPVRRELATKTIFNILGPLTNPAGTKRQAIGTFNDKAAELMAEASLHLDQEKVCFVCTENKFDEILLNGSSKIIEVKNGQINSFETDNKSLGLPEVQLSEVQGDDAKTNAGIILEIFQNKKLAPAYYVVVANAALGIYAASDNLELKESVQIAEESVQSGKALEKLEMLRDFGVKN